MTGTDLNTATVGGLLAYCDWLKQKGYQGANTIESWKTAIKKVFEAVEPEQYETIKLDGIDLDDYVQRFRKLAGSNYKTETIDVYASRIQSAVDAQEYYRQHGKPPTFRKPARRGNPSRSSSGKVTPKTQSEAVGSGADTSGSLVRFPFPLRSGQMAELKLPAHLDKTDADRLSAFLRALQYEQPPQLPERTGGEEAKAA